MATISGAKSPHLLRVLGRFWYVQYYGEVHAALAAAADCEAARRNAHGREAGLVEDAGAAVADHGKTLRNRHVACIEIDCTAAPRFAADIQRPIASESH